MEQQTTPAAAGTKRRRFVALSHWADYDAPRTNHTVQAHCGQRVTEREIAKGGALPTCSVCCDEYLASDHLLDDDAE